MTMASPTSIERILFDTYEGLDGISPGDGSEAPAPSAGMDALLTTLDFEMDQLQSLVDAPPAHAEQASARASEAREPAAQRRPGSRRSLLVGMARQQASAVRWLLERRGLSVDTMLHPESALSLVDQVPFDVLLVRLPLPGMELRDFLAKVRKPGHPCAGAHLFVLAPPPAVAEAEGFVGQGANEVVPLANDPSELERALGPRARLASRASAHCDITIHHSRAGESFSELCRTVNLSETGMLIETPKPLPNGTSFTFVLILPNTSRRITGVAVCQRHTNRERDGVCGFGARIVELAPADQAILRSFVRLQLARSSP